MSDFTYWKRLPKSSTFHLFQPKGYEPLCRKVKLEAGADLKRSLVSWQRRNGEGGTFCGWCYEASEKKHNVLPFRHPFREMVIVKRSALDGPREVEEGTP